MKDFINDQKNRDILPTIVYGDTHYNSSENINDSASKGVELKGPVTPVPGKKSNAKNIGFSANVGDKTVTCPQGKHIVLRPESELLKQRRALMETQEFKTEMHRRNGVEGTLSGLVRGQGMRRSRHRGKGKFKLQLKFTGAAANIVRLHRKRQNATHIAA